MTKTARITFLTTPGFKLDLEHRAAKAGVSVGQLIRHQFEHTLSGDEELLVALTDELRHSVEAARQAVAEAVSETEAALAESSSGTRAKDSGGLQPA